MAAAISSWRRDRGQDMRHNIERARMPAVTVNGRTYQAPQAPTVIVCIDGGDPAYFSDGFDRGILPALQNFREQGFFPTAKAVVPPFTNPNTLSIVTGVPPAIHGISGNFFLDPESGTELMMNAPASCGLGVFMRRCPSK